MGLPETDASTPCVRPTGVSHRARDLSGRYAPISLDLETRVFEVEVPFDAASGFVAQAALAPELQ